MDEDTSGTGSATGRPATAGFEPESHGDEGGDPACWAALVCPECGAVESEGHRSGCSLQER